MIAFDDIKPGARLRGLDPAGIAEIVQVARFGPDALNLVFRANGRVANVSFIGARNQRLNSSMAAGPMFLTLTASCGWRPRGRRLTDAAAHFAIN
jgi:hypothetical protein